MDDRMFQLPVCVCLRQLQERKPEKHSRPDRLVGRALHWYYLLLLFTSNVYPSKPKIDGVGSAKYYEKKYKVHI